MENANPSFSTIGFGDLTPSSTISRVVVMFLIILVILYIPWQTGKIIEIFNSMSKYQRARHYPKRGTSHVILSGDVTYSTIVDFCREFFAVDQVGTVVILSDTEPAIEVRRLLNHPFYRSRIIYLQGNILSAPDLQRAQMGYSTGLFILSADPTSCANEDEEDIKTYEDDTKILLHALYAKTSFSGLPIFAQVKDVRSRELASHCGIDRIIALDEIKATLFASECVCPGILALTLNLIHTYNDTDSEPTREIWTSEYQCGIGSQVQSFRIPSGLVGLSYTEAVLEIYNAFNTIVFALVSVNSGFNQNSIRFKVEKNYKLKADDIAFCIGDGGEELTLRIALQFKNFTKRQDVEQRDLDIEMNMFVKTVDLNSSPPLFPIESSSPDLSESHFEEASFGMVPDGLKDHIILTGHISARILLQFITAIRKRSTYPDSLRPTAVHKNTPIVLVLENIPDQNILGSVWKEIASYHSVWVMKGRAMQREVLGKAGIAACNRIVVFSKQNVGQESSDAQSVFIVKLIQKVRGL